MADHSMLYNIQGQTAVITGGGGGLGSVMARALAETGVRVAVISLHATSSARVVEAIRADGGEAIGIACDVMDRDALEQARVEILRSFASIDILVNAAGGNQPGATSSREVSFFDLDRQAVDAVFNLNFMGTFQSCQVFGQSMVEQGHGCIVNIA